MQKEIVDAIKRYGSAALFAVVVLAIPLGSAHAQAQTQRPNFVVIMGDDIGMWNIGAFDGGDVRRTSNS
jgi:arylsulfatase